MGFTKFIFHKLLGWKIKGSFLPEVKKAVIIVVPHTSWHDFYVGALTRRISKTEIHWVGKKELFKWPMGAYFRWMGGSPLDRTSGQNKVQAIAQLFKEKDEFRLTLAPEGTRKKVDTWKTGYYYIALESEVPIIPVSFDYKTKTVTINEPFQPSGDIEKDTPLLRAYYDGVVGKRPEYT
ncbi:1-acyl-sn-glycerol-3-phosphate acyltransferase [Aureisphaera galaxeae]|uniref:1-acyl-sn-glycerol-3-phosphate acyltransferase n=1 Tax=Aureisphaera galaxeae TaxID=1538023 RepID=UPI00234FC2FB|nr:1-acyl-sn-glycerol-3-phosphate acyltransferase [Aureisphaera galaxeae]MDC8004116.1 1-acyl-sn-glycerol-3-phosphate acyltransferase [Aureisphaera galaxeae]